MIRLLRLLARDKPAASGAALVALLCLAAVFAPILAPYPGDAVSIHLTQRLLPPGPLHWLGTDRMGADLLSRLLFGARTTLVVAVVAVTAALLIGVPIGIAAAWRGGRVAETLMRVSDVFLAIPQLILAIAIAQTLGPALPNVILALSVTYWPWFARLVYAQTLSAMNEPFMQAAQTIGAHPVRVILRHLMAADIAAHAGRRRINPADAAVSIPSPMTIAGPAGSRRTAPPQDEPRPALTGSALAFRPSAVTYVR